MDLLGWTPPDSTAEIFTLEQAAAQFELERVNKAGAKFDWAKLDWINSQYLHQLPPGELVELLLPYWQEAGYPVDLNSDRSWVESLTTMIAPSLNRLTDGVSEAKLFFSESVAYTEEAIEFLKQEGVTDILTGVITALKEAETFEAADAKAIIKQVTKGLKVKKGLVMRSLRAGLTGEMHGPDLIQSWLLLHQKGWDQLRLEKALSLI